MHIVYSSKLKLKNILVSNLLVHPVCPKQKIKTLKCLEYICSVSSLQRHNVLSLCSHPLASLNHKGTDKCTLTITHRSVVTQYGRILLSPACTCTI